LTDGGRLGIVFSKERSMSTPKLKFSNNADGYRSARQNGIDVSARVRLVTKTGIRTDDAFVAGIGPSGITVRIGTQQIDIIWKDIIELRRIQVIP
jgi:hypothetical protein